MRIEKQVIKKYTLELTEQEFVDLVEIMGLYSNIYETSVIDDEFIDNIVQKSNKIGNITARNLINGCVQ